MVGLIAGLFEGGAAEAGAAEAAASAAMKKADTGKPEDAKAEKKEKPTATRSTGLGEIPVPSDKYNDSPKPVRQAETVGNQAERIRGKQFNELITVNTQTLNVLKNMHNFQQEKLEEENEARRIAELEKKGGGGDGGGFFGEIGVAAQKTTGILSALTPFASLLLPLTKELDDFRKFLQGTGDKTPEPGTKSFTRHVTENVSTIRTLSKAYGAAGSKQAANIAERIPKLIEKRNVEKIIRNSPNVVAGNFPNHFRGGKPIEAINPKATNKITGAIVRIIEPIAARATITVLKAISWAAKKIANSKLLKFAYFIDFIIAIFQSEGKIDRNVIGELIKAFIMLLSDKIAAGLIGAILGSEVPLFGNIAGFALGIIASYGIEYFGSVIIESVATHLAYMLVKIETPGTAAQKIAEEVSKFYSDKFKGWFGGNQDTKQATPTAKPAAGGTTTTALPPLPSASPNPPTNGGTGRAGKPGASPKGEELKGDSSVFGTVIASETRMLATMFPTATVAALGAAYMNDALHPSTKIKDRRDANPTNNNIDPKSVLEFGRGDADEAHFNQMKPEMKKAVLDAAKEYMTKYNKKLKVNSSVRSDAEQKVLYDRSVAQGHPGILDWPSGKRTPVAQVGSSTHKQGYAIDIHNGQDPRIVEILQKYNLVHASNDDPHYTLKGHESHGGGGSGGGYGGSHGGHGHAKLGSGPSPQDYAARQANPGYIYGQSEQKSAEPVATEPKRTVKTGKRAKKAKANDNTVSNYMDKQSNPGYIYGQSTSGFPGQGDVPDPEANRGSIDDKLYFHSHSHRNYG